MSLTPGRIAEAIARVEMAGERHWIPLLRALGQRRIVLIVINRTSDALPIRWLKRHPLPALILVTDDDFRSSGPTAFPDARKALRYAATHLIHGARAEIEHYEGAILAAEAKGSCCLVETDAAHLDEWIAFAALAARPRRVPTLVVRPTEGAGPIVREAVH
ncbi:hypothetical protein [Neoroseomonas rubea]|uniref:hypothetical protein n=1 Tax=Neoroseomonas rubea TaxID=2748666 RepID=UPI0018DF15E7|nr:hypothetical protein [Roseomonas rubea]